MTTKVALSTPIKMALLIPTAVLMAGCQSSLDSWLHSSSSSSGSSNSAALSSASAPPSDGTTSISAPQISKYDVNLYPINKLVCNPTGGPAPGEQGGLVANLFWEDASQPRYGNVSDFFANAHESEHTFFYTQLDVPTRLFRSAFRHRPER